jgi:hypothetical protein
MTLTSSTLARCGRIRCVSFMRVIRIALADTFGQPGIRFEWDDKSVEILTITRLPNKEVLINDHSHTLIFVSVLYLIIS